MKKLFTFRNIKRAWMSARIFFLASYVQAQALNATPEFSPIKTMILFVLDVYAILKIIQCVKNAIDHMADASKGDTTAAGRVWGSLFAIIGILFVGTVLNILIIKAGEFGARPLSSVLSGN